EQGRGRPAAHGEGTRAGRGGADPRAAGADRRGGRSPEGGDRRGGPSRLAAGDRRVRGGDQPAGPPADERGAAQGGRRQHRGRPGRNETVTARGGPGPLY